MYYAVIKDTLVVNYVEWDGITQWSPPDGCIAIPDPEGKGGIGHTYDGENFHRPVPVQVPSQEPIDTLKAFLSNHPEVAELLK